MQECVYGLLCALGGGMDAVWRRRRRRWHLPAQPNSHIVMDCVFEVFMTVCRCRSAVLFELIVLSKLFVGVFFFYSSALLIINTMARYILHFVHERSDVEFREIGIFFMPF